MKTQMGRADSLLTCTCFCGGLSVSERSISVVDHLFRRLQERLGLFDGYGRTGPTQRQPVGYLARRQSELVQLIRLEALANTGSTGLLLREGVIWVFQRIPFVCVPH